MKHFAARFIFKKKSMKTRLKYVTYAHEHRKVSGKKFCVFFRYSNQMSFISICYKFNDALNKSEYGPHGRVNCKD